MDNYEIFEAIRKKEKGGTLIGAHKALNPMLIQEYSEEFELLIIEVTIRNREIRIMVSNRERKDPNNDDPPMVQVKG